jgi:hypothetical protein
MGRRTVGTLLVTLGLLAQALPADAWGDLGHKIICEIAYQELNAKARAEVDRLIGLDTFQSFPESCVWPDHPRKRAEEHFINVDRAFTHFTATTCPTAPKCLFTAIAADTEVLKTSTDDQAKLASLKYLGHWVGDIHQPLHVSFADDRGGNYIRESGPCQNSLHTVWDTCIIEKKLGTDYQQVARDLLDGLSSSDKTAWIAAPVEGWASESLRVTRTRDLSASTSKGRRSLARVKRRRW